MDGCKLVELEKKLKKEQGTVTRERLEELLGEAIDPGKVAIAQWAARWGVKVFG